MLKQLLIRQYYTIGWHDRMRVVRKDLSKYSPEITSVRCATIKRILGRIL
jgi:hypothetical protein